MTPRVAAVAFAASALIAAPAFADHGKPKVRTSAAVSVDLGGAQITLAGGELFTSYRGYGYNRGYRGNRGYGNGHDNRRFERQKRRTAVRACRAAVERQGYRIGFRDVDYEGTERIRKIGPNGYIVRAEFEFESRRRDFEKDVVCEVRQGRVVDIDGLPHRGRRGHGNSSYMTNYGGLRPTYGN